MTADPLDALRLPVIGIEPRPEFAGALLRRLTAARQPAPAQPAAGPVQDAAAPLAPAGPVPAAGNIPPPSAATVRYYVGDIGEAVSFYCGLLGFAAQVQAPPAFAMLSRGDLRLLLSVPGLHGAGRELPGGTMPEPGGWNRIALQVADLPAAVAALEAGGVVIRDEIRTGTGVRQAIVADPSGNLIELYEAATRPRGRPE